MNELVTLVCGSDNTLTVTTLVGFMVLVLCIEAIGSMIKTLSHFGRK